MTDRDPSDPRPHSTPAPTDPAADPSPPALDAAEGPPDEPTQPPDSVPDAPESEAQRRKILIGSQRDPAALARRQHRDWEPVDTLPLAASPAETAEAAEAAPVEAAPVEPAPSEAVAPAADVSAEAGEAASGVSGEASGLPEADDSAIEGAVSAVPRSSGRVPLPNLRHELPADLEEEFEAAMRDAPLEDLMDGGVDTATQERLPQDSKHKGRVVAVQREDLFIELGSREQGCLSIRDLDDPPEIGDEVEVVIRRFNPDDGLYEVSIPNAAVTVDDWGDIQEGMLVEARITGHNTGGLECQVSHLRGFIPVSQIALYRVEDLSEFVDQKFGCLVTEANPARRNLVLSRRAVLEREREEARERMWDTLEVGQSYEGVVRKLMDFGAFVDIGGVDGLLHISQLAWGRVGHPSEVLAEGQAITVKIEKIDRENRRIGLGYRDMLENPWEAAAKKYAEGHTFEGTVTKLMEFGAFVELEPGVEGLVHISELSHKRIWRPSDVVKEGDTVEVLVLSVDPAAQRMSLSMKQLHQPEPDKKAKSDSDEPGEPVPTKKAPRHTGPLKGGIGRGTGGEQFGLKW